MLTYFSAGSRDSPLTTHGVLQARRLGSHLAERTEPEPLLHIFSSDLQRAAMTAQAVADAHKPSQVEVVQLADLRERDFRSTEGAKFGSRALTGGGGNPHPDAETQTEMTVRVERFIRGHLAPVLASVDLTDRQGSVVVVAHGIILNVLLRSLLTRYAPTEPEPGKPEWLATWSNTGYLEAVVTVTPPGPGLVATQTPSARSVRSDGPGRISLGVVSVNNTDHLRGLRKTRGGIGSAKFDNKQKTMDSFFKPAPKSGG